MARRLMEVSDMTQKEWLMAVVEAVLWYVFIYVLLYSLKNEVNLYLASLVLLVVGYVATITCPWVQKWLKTLDRQQ